MSALTKNRVEEGKKRNGSERHDNILLIEVRFDTEEDSQFTF